MVSEFECREAAAFVHVSWRQWQALISDERAKAIAHYRMHIVIETHVSDAIARSTPSRR